MRHPSAFRSTSTVTGLPSTPARNVTRQPQASVARMGAVGSGTIGHVPQYDGGSIAWIWDSNHSFGWMPSALVRIVPSDNVPMLIALGKDPLFQKRTRTDTLYGLVDLMDEARTAPDRLTDPPPILLLRGLNDQVIPPAPTKAVIASLGARADVREYPKGYHMLLRDLDGEAVDKDVAAWVLRGRK